MESNLIVELKSISVYQRKQLVLKDINLEISRGEFVYLIGRTGSGKSSLLKTLYADLEAQGAKAEVAGYDLNALKNKEIPFLRRRLGIVFQDFQLLTDRSVRDNLLFVLKATGWKDKEEINTRIFEVLKKVGMQNKDFKMPHELSGGEQQRIAIARALLNDPELILADEPTGNLDPETSREIMKVLVEIGQSGRAVLMATHDHNLLKDYPGRTLHCENESIFEKTEVAETKEDSSPTPVASNTSADTAISAESETKEVLETASTAETEMKETEDTVLPTESETKATEASDTAPNETGNEDKNPIENKASSQEEIATEAENSNPENSAEPVAKTEKPQSFSDTLKQLSQQAQHKDEEA
jgi:cell division transport system ATP-binding protein